MQNAKIPAETWERINALVGRIYQTAGFPDLDMVVEGLREVVPFSHSMTCLIGGQGERVEFFEYRSADMPEEHIALYRDKYIYYDFILWYSAEAERREFRQSDIIAEPYFSGSKFMREWLEPIGAHFGAGLNIAQDGIAYGNVAIYRSLEEGDFTDLDMAVLGVVNEHLCTCFARLFPMGLQSGALSPESSELAARYHLTPREEELVTKVARGVPRRSLAEELFISENTVKRHLNSVYAKCGVRSFDELARLVGTGGRVVVVEKLISGLGVPH